jgi:hypothetical protein
MRRSRLDQDEPVGARIAAIGQGSQRGTRIHWEHLANESDMRPDDPPVSAR